MRHVRLNGRNLKNLSSFKDKIGDILKELNKFGEAEKTEAVSYIHNCINHETQPSTSMEKSAKHVKKVYQRRKLINRSSRNLKKKTSYSKKHTVSYSKINFKCKECGQIEKTRKLMLKHLQTHVGTPKSCLKCKKTFNGQVPFDWHLNYYCRSLISRKSKYKCNVCPREFVSKRTLQSHLQGHKRNNCTYCDKVLTQRVHLIKHLLEEHSVKLERETHQCSYCEKRFIKKCSLYYHMKQHLPDKYVCLECGNIYETDDDFERHKEEHSIKKHFTCSKCGDKFSRRQQYLLHLKRHNQYRCVTCKENYASRAKVLIHKQQGHEVEGLSPRFICPHCPVAFQRERRFHMHMRKHSDENRSVNCKYCKKTFNSPYAYYKHCITINHEKFSPEINDIACTKCGKHFAKRYDLRQHMYRVHNMTKQYVSCQYCDYKTVHKCNMDRHVALHFRKENEFTCEYCGKNCDSIASLNDHIMYNHIQTKQFKCDKCEKSFKRNSELVRHQDSHSDERPHVCSLCNKSYKRLNHLKRHEQQAHKMVTESRRIKKVGTVLENSIQCNDNYNLQSSATAVQEHESNAVVLSIPENVEQFGYVLPDRGWNITTEGMYNVAIDYSNQYSYEGEIVINNENTS